MAEHPITPPPELVEGLQDLGNLDAIRLAYQAGTDIELEACCEWLYYNYPSVNVSCLREHRRPKPPSLKEQALEELDELLAAVKQLGIFNPPKNIRRALEQLND